MGTDEIDRRLGGAAGVVILWIVVAACLTYILLWIFGGGRPEPTRKETVREAPAEPGRVVPVPRAFPVPVEMDVEEEESSDDSSDDVPVPDGEIPV